MTAPTDPLSLGDGSRGALAANIRREVSFRRTLRHAAELLITAAVLFLFLFVIPAIFGGM